LACDLNVNNTLALQNSKLIKAYVSIDPRVRPLAMVIKYWAKRRGINDAGMKKNGAYICFFNFREEQKK
jgi:DNA polymerase sigma